MLGEKVLYATISQHLYIGLYMYTSAVLAAILANSLWLQGFQYLSVMKITKVESNPDMGF